MSNDRVKAIKTYCEAILETVEKYENGQTNSILVMHDVKDYTAWMREVASEVLNLDTPTPEFKKKLVEV